MRVSLPAVYSINQKRLSNEIRCLSVPAMQIEAEVPRYSHGKHSGYLIRSQALGHEVAVLKKAATYPADLRWIVVADVGEGFAELDLRSAHWARHPDIHAEPINYGQAFRQTLTSWRDAFHYVPENPAERIVGLRPPQIGAIHAVHAHWAVSEGVATVVLPTGTGKTETMLSLLITAAASKLLVVVPTDVLRTQLSDKFVSLGILKHPDSAVLNKSALTPIICSLRHVPRTVEEVDQVFEVSHVIVTTSSILSKATFAEHLRESASTRAGPWPSWVGPLLVCLFSCLGHR